MERAITSANIRIIFLLPFVAHKRFVGIYSMATLNHLKRNYTAACMAVGLGKLDQHLQVTDVSPATCSCAGDEVHSSISTPLAKRRIVGSVFGVLQTSKNTTSGINQIVISQKIRECNNAGVLMFARGEFSTASSMFIQAATLRHSALLATSEVESDLELTFPPKNVSVDGLFLSSNGVDNCYIETPTTTYIYQRMEFDEGLNIYTHTERIADNDHPITVEATLFYNIAQSQRQQENFDAAWRYFRRALHVLLPPSRTETISEAFCSQRTSNVHCIVVAVLHNLGLLSYRKGELQEAVQFYELALQHGAAIGGRQSISVGLALNCLGVLHYHLSSSCANSQEYYDGKDTNKTKMLSPSSFEGSNKALHFFEEALRILSVTPGPDTTAVATCLNNMGRVMVQREDFTSAFTYYQQALYIRRQRLGADDLDYAATAFNAGQSLHQLRDYDRAIILYKEFLRVASVRFHNNHRDGTNSDLQLR